MTWRAKLKDRAGIVAFLMSALVFAGMSVWKTPVKPTTPVLVPMLRQNVLPGSRIKSTDIEWIAVAKIHSVDPKTLEGYAKTSLFRGEVLSPQEIGSTSPSTVVVAIAPSTGSETNVAHTGDFVDVLILSQDNVLWQSGPLPVESVSALSGSGATVEVMMSMKVALQYERAKNLGTIEIVGMQS